MAKQSREEVIKSLKNCLEYQNKPGHCDNCPYKCYAYEGELYEETNCDEELMRDALEYLLTQKADDGWHLYSKEKPEVEGFYLVQDKFENIQKIFYSEKSAAFVGVVGPIAWRLMPEKYVAKED